VGSAATLTAKLVGLDLPDDYYDDFALP